MLLTVTCFYAKCLWILASDENLKLFKSYLSDWYHYINIRNTMSKKLKVTYGASQESCLGFLLFLLYINDLPMVSNFDTSLFAKNILLMMSDWSIESLSKQNPFRTVCQNKLSFVVIVVWKGIHARSDTNKTGAKCLSFYYPFTTLLYCPDQMLAVML